MMLYFSTSTLEIILMPDQERPRFQEQADRDIVQNRLLDEAKQKASEMFPDTNFEDLPFLQKMALIYHQKTGLKGLDGKRPATPAEIATVIKIKNKRL